MTGKIAAGAKHTQTQFFFLHFILIWLASGRRQSRCGAKITFPKSKSKWSLNSCKMWFFVPFGYVVNPCHLCCSSVGRMAMQFVATQMMSTVWNSPSSSQVLKPSVRNFTAASLCLSPACKLPWRFLTPARCFAAGLLGYAAGASDSDRRQPAVPEEAGAAWQQVKGALVYRVQPGAAAPGCAGGRFLVARLWLTVVLC